MRHDMKKLIFVSTAAAIVAFSGTAFAQDVVVKVPQTVREYVIAHPADPVIIEENITEGYVLPETVEVHPIPDDPGFGYIYVDGSPVIVSDRKSTRLNSSHVKISYAVFCLKKKK